MGRERIANGQNEYPLLGESEAGLYQDRLHFLFVLDCAEYQATDDGIEPLLGGRQVSEAILVKDLDAGNPPTNLADASYVRCLFVPEWTWLSLVTC